jgi:hypothetical protein
MIKRILAGHQWCMPVTPAMEEAEIRGWQFRASLDKKSLLDSILMKKSWAWWHMTIITMAESIK